MQFIEKKDIQNLDDSKAVIGMKTSHHAYFPYRESLTKVLSLDLVWVEVKQQSRLISKGFCFVHHSKQHSKLSATKFVSN